MSNKVPLPVVKRLPRYHRYLSDLQKHGIGTVSSSALAQMLGTTASQVRQDFNCFGGFGQQGVGYNVKVLCARLGELLTGGNELSVILIGTGRLGRTMSHFLATVASGFRLVAFFDKNRNEVGQTLEGLTILDVDTLPEFCKEHKVDVAALCVPEEAANDFMPTLKQLGIRGFWNFSHYDFSNDPELVVENVHLNDSLMSLGFRVRHEDF